MTKVNLKRAIPLEIPVLRVYKDIRFVCCCCISYPKQ